jgi:hypothetical protein
MLYLVTNKQKFGYQKKKTKKYFITFWIISSVSPSAVAADAWEISPLIPAVAWCKICVGWSFPYYEQFID